MSCLPADSLSFHSSCVQNRNITQHTLPCAEPAEEVTDVTNSQQGGGSNSSLTAGALWRWVLGWLLLLLPALSASGQVQFGSEAVGTPATQTVNVAFSGSATVNSVEVLTLGGQKLDFQAAGTFNCAAQTCTQSVTFTPAYPGIRLGAVVLLDSSSNVLGTTYLSGTGLGGLAVLVPGNMIPVAGSGAYNEVDDGDEATNADLYLPASVVLDGAGNMYIADSVHNRIRMVSSGKGATIQFGSGFTYPTAGDITTIAGNGTAAKGADGVPAYNSALNVPTGLALDGAGNLYICDTGNNRVRMIAVSTGVISTVAGNGQAGDSNGNNVGDGGPATAANLNQPWGVSVDPAGVLYIADTFNHRIRKVDPATGLISTIAGTGFTNGNGNGAFSGDAGQATAARLNHPYAVAFDAAGNMYIPDSSNNRVRMVNPSGIITTFAGNGSGGFGGDGAAAANANIYGPTSVIVDPAQNLYIADTANNAIRKVNAATHLISTIVQTGKGRNAFENVLYTNSLYAPMGLALDGSGNLYLADYFFMRIREIQSGASLLDFTATAVRAGETSTTTNDKSQVVENDGNAPLTLSSITPKANSGVYPNTTTCNPANALAVDATCVVTAVFSPLKSGNPLFGELDVANQTVNNPLDIMLVGDAIPANAVTMMLASSPNPSSFGQSVIFTATLTTGAGTGSLTGTVTFTDGTTTLQSGVHIAATSTANTYTATYSTPALTVGTHTITASYSGDGAHLASDPNISPLPVVTQEVNELTSTILTSSVNPSVLGSSVTFTAKVTVTGGGGVTPDGQITFYDGGAVLASGGNIDSTGQVSFSTTALTSGTHIITAVYSGDTSNGILASTSALLKQDVQATSTTVVTSSANPSTYGTPVTFTATVTSASGIAASGVVAFLDGGTQIGTATLAAGVGTFTTSSLSATSHAITVTYPGDTNAGPGTSAPIIQVVNLTGTATSLISTPNPGIAGKPVVLTAAVKSVSGSAAITGTVTFTDGTATIGSAKISSNGTVSINPLLSPGPHAIVATYGGDSNDNGSASAALPLAVNLANTSVAVTSSGSPAVVLAPVTISATVTGNGGTPTGVVTFYADGASVGTGTLGSNGVATYSDSALGVGSHNITASYAGDTDNGPSTSSVFIQAVQAISTVTSLASTATTGTTAQLILLATVIGGSGPTPTGTVTFTNGSQTIGVATLDSSGVASMTPDLAPATYNIVASYSGDAVHGPSASSVVKITGNPEGFGIKLNPATLSMATSQNATVTITLNSNNGYADTIGLGCGTLPAGVTCHFASNSVALKANGNATVQLTIDTNTPLGGGSTARNSTGDGGFSLAGLFLPGGLIFGFVAWRFRKRNALLLTAALVLFLSGTLLVTGCGGTFSQSTAAPGTYTIEVTGVGSSSNITHYQDITLTVTK